MKNVWGVPRDEQMMHEEPIYMVYVRLIEYVCCDISEDSWRLSTNPSIPWLHSQLMSNRLIHHQIRDVSISNLAAKSLVQREMAYAYLMPSFLVTVHGAVELPVPIPNLCLTGKRNRAVIINRSIITHALRHNTATKVTKPKTTKASERFEDRGERKSRATIQSCHPCSNFIRLCNSI